ncbi:MAG: phosphatidylcholine/phosphatidylserine synthase [Rhodospirillales bacterium]|nr:phosphatidylcholine/phosphatidylserine synthase [Rhodospirillales bacterium]MBO6786091.1 phosphatidylcholine/phosphatidylserine synthase [Rhodospirillales bacterium]
MDETSQQPETGTPPKPRGIRVMSLNKLIPNVLTLMGLASGLTSVRFALQDQWEFAAMAVAVAALLDALDGRVARLLKGASKFGAELDSLSDFVCFGVCPALILYLWAMQDAGRWGWLVCMLFAMCCGLRLARFNVALEDPDKPKWAGQFFTGVPAPAGAGIVLLPLIMSLNLGDDFFRNPGTVAIWELASGALLISTIPTFSFKTSRIPRAWFLPVMITIAVGVTFVMSAPWWTLAAILILYLCLIPVSIRRYKRLQARDAAGLPPEDEHEIEDDDDDGENEISQPRA